MKIIIVGGGTAGWLAALFLKKINGKSRDITVIESSKIGIVGAGEGSTGIMSDIIQNRMWNFDCNEDDFLKFTGSTPNLGIKNKHWKDTTSEYFGPIDASPTSGQLLDYIQLHVIAKQLKIHTSTRNGILLENGKSTFFNRDTNIQKTSSIQGNAISGAFSLNSHAYHFDAHKVGKYFKTVCEKDSVKHIDAIVQKVNINEQGNVDSVLLDSGETITGDFFVDASGFNRLILEKAYGIKWKSYKEHLPVNTAMPFILPHENEKDIDNFTTAWAQKNGWMWQIPTADRIGCGYVFCDEFTSHEDAQKEIESVLKREIDPIRFLKFDTGRMEKLWHKNVLTVGLAAAFAEPLEATSIHTTICQLYSFCTGYFVDNDSINDGNINQYNSMMGKMYDDMRDFLVIHYMGGRTDSEFWKYISSGKTKTEFVTWLMEICKIRSPKSSDWLAYHGFVGSPLYNVVLANLGILSPDICQRELINFNAEKLSEQKYIENLTFTSNFCDNLLTSTDFVKSYQKDLHQFDDYQKLRAVQRNQS
jgi:flavin-dependent dehydrogenase